MPISKSDARIGVVNYKVRMLTLSSYRRLLLFSIYSFNNDKAIPFYFKSLNCFQRLAATFPVCFGPVTSKWHMDKRTDVPNRKFTT